MASQNRGRRVAIYGAIAQIAKTINVREPGLASASFLPSTLQPFMPVKTERKIRISEASALLSVGTVVSYPTPITLRPAGQVALAVPTDFLRSVTGVPATYCNPE